MLYGCCLLISISSILYRRRCPVELPVYTATLQPHLWTWSILASIFRSWWFAWPPVIEQKAKRVQISKCRKKTRWPTSLGVVAWGDVQHIRLVSCRFSNLLPLFDHRSYTVNCILLQQSLIKYMHLIAIHKIKGEKEYYKAKHNIKIRPKHYVHTSSPAVWQMNMWSFTIRTL